MGEERSGQCVTDVNERSPHNLCSDDTVHEEMNISLLVISLSVAFNTVKNSIKLNVLKD